MDSSVPNFLAWRRCNNLVRSWILISISKEIANSEIYASTACEVWLDLKDRFTQKNRPRIVELKKAIASLNQKQSSVSAYFINLKSLWEELASYRNLPICPCGVTKDIHEIFHQEYVLQFLMGLDDLINGAYAYN